MNFRHQCRVYDRERQLRDAIDRFRAAVSEQGRQDTALSVISAASRLLESRLRARKANAPIRNSQLDKKIDEMVDRGVQGIVNEFHVDEVLEFVEGHERLP